MERFWSKVDKNGPIPAHVPEIGPCWLWTGRLSGWGRYGMFDPLSRKRGGKPVLTHRFSYVLEHGEDAIGDKLVCHRCDNKLCVRPAHLFLGTAKDNSRDAASKGRCVLPGLRGEQVAGSKLKADDVRWIRWARAYSGAKLSVMGAAFGVTKENIHAVVSGATWRSV